MIDKLKDGNSCNPCENIKPEDWIANFRSFDDSYKTRVHELEAIAEQLEKHPVYTTLDNRIQLSEVYISISKLKKKKLLGLMQFVTKCLNVVRMLWGHVS